MTIKNLLLLFAIFLGSVSAVYASAILPNKVSGVPDKLFANLATTRWLHGSKSCKTDKNPAIQVIKADASSYVLRQNKCVTFEAPFIYVLFGQDTVLVVDTGANESAEQSPIFQTVQSLIEQQKGSSNGGERKILVVHSHSHSDHTKGDTQFVGKPGVEVVGTDAKSLETQLGLSDWPNTLSSIDLGGRMITFIAIPGHQEQSIAIYDEQTGWLLTGDSLYPGSIRVKNWDVYKSSIQRLFEFSQSHPISLILGAHVEFNAQAKKLYKIGETYQPNEAPLALSIDQLRILNDTLKTTEEATKLTFERFVIAPLSRFEKLLIRALSSN